MTPLQSLYADAVFRLSNLTWLEGIDLLLVSLAFFGLLNLIQRSRAGFLLRGTLALGALFLIVTIILPLPTFDWLIRISLIALLVGTPIIFQPELRRLLERLGRNTAMGRAVRHTATEEVLADLMPAIENLSQSRTGALIVLEGNDSLQEVTKTGVAFGGEVTGELLQSIFFPGTPLHDGAVIIRENSLVAAGCVLPLSQDPLPAERRLGTRHRAAVGLSQHYDALVIVVSEETGEISVARYGQLYRPLKSASLREQVFNFYSPVSPPSSTLFLNGLFKRSWKGGGPQPSFLHRVVPFVGLLFISGLLGLAAWSFVIEQTNPARRYRLDNIPLRVADLPATYTLMTPAPATVSAIVQTTADIGLTLRPSSFQAIVSLKEVSPGLNRATIQVNSGASSVRILSVDPAALDLEVESIISRTLPVTIDLPDQQNLSPAYIMVGQPVASPQQAQITGPAPLVETVSRVQTSVSLANAGASLQETRPLHALDEQGKEVAGVTVEPAQVQISVPIQQRANARDVGIRAVPNGPPPPGYWLSGLSVTPSFVTLKGSPERLAEIGSFIDTSPIDISQAFGNLEVQVPLALPADVQALDSNGGSVVRIVTATVQIKSRTGDLIVTRPVELLGLTPDITATVAPPNLELLLSGPLPTLQQIEANPDLIQVWVNPNELTPNQSTEVAPQLITPEGVKVQLMPPSVLVTLSKPALTWQK
ncbi:MAG: diadenylate cyclase CdaA [Anaerolineae bacterium]|nr:diadenylate cyclase CdaA [Anaerolineae bacterium]